MQTCPGPLSGCWHYRMDLKELMELPSHPFSCLYEAGLKQLVLFNCQQVDQDEYIKFLLGDILDQTSFETLVVLSTQVAEKDPRYGLLTDELEKRYAESDAAQNFVLVPGETPQRIVYCDCSADFRGVSAIATGVVPQPEMHRALAFTKCREVWWNGQGCIVAGVPQRVNSDIYWHFRGLKAWNEVQRGTGNAYFTYIPPEHRRPNVDTDSE